ncbi:1,4-dihydroxy-2-naphthoate prenyltransferase [Algoriphagus aquaeductus]|uniref:1,4-dihydroxy-2-naphthoate octaprenyltransferase n=1 Tax=Algoriphagus aquaeductus TaxID=475299 RepID=A0A326RQM9_9BACT|nr:1,4-dihydroxy-2-naphthoate polyprenyltransferase [Algoriphagus aquaeductus]PZV83889.1 1,4-dihydroxy-2-naphthoate prenyltransferase [Algoriphagus aquaeductus]
MKKEITTKREAWLHAVRLRTLPLALASILAGSFLAKWQDGFRWEILLLASLTTIFLQILSNLSNDYGDTVHGADSADRQGPVRAVQSGIITLAEMKRAMYLFGFLSLISGLLLIFFALEDWKLFLLFLGLGIAAIWAAITYTSGSNPYGYAGLGDLSVFAFFGLTGVLGTYFLHTLSFESLAVWIAISLGCFSTAVLNINNIRDIESDEKAGKKSIPVRIGREKAVQYNWVLLIIGYLSLVLFALFSTQYFTLLAFLASPLMLKVGFGVQKAKTSERTDPFLKIMAISTLIWTLLFGLGIII